MAIRSFLTVFFSFFLWGITIPKVIAAEPVSHNARIISIGGSVTEIIHALGFSDQIIAVDSTSYYPETMTSKPNIGYMRQLATEPILSLSPSLVFVIEDAGPPAVIDQLRAAGLAVTIIPDQPSVQGVFDKIESIATALGANKAGQELQSRIQAELDSLHSLKMDPSSPPRVLFLLSAGRGAPLAGGKQTAANTIIELAGGINAIEGFSGYKPISSEVAITAKPDVLLVTRRSFDILGGEEALLTLPGIDLTPAGETRRLIVMDDLLLLGLGPRIGSAISQLAQSLHPDSSGNKRKQNP